MSHASVPPMVLVILDGWGYREATDGNAVAAAKTPVMDSLWAAYPRTLIRTSGKDVGLPDGQMGELRSRPSEYWCWPHCAPGVGAYFRCR